LETGYRVNKVASGGGAGRRRALMIATGLGMLSYLGAALYADSGKFFLALRQLGWLGGAAVLSLSVVNYWLRFARWQYYMTALGHRLPLLAHLLSYLSGFALTVSPAKAGEAVRSLYLHEHGVPYAETVAGVFVERLLDLLAVVVLAGLIVSEHRTYWPVLIGVSGFALLLVLAAGHPALPDAVQRLARRYHGIGHRPLAAIGALLVASRCLLQPRLLVLGFLIGLLSWAAEGVGFHLLCRSLDSYQELPVDIGIYGAAVVAGCAAFFMPGGIGGMEVAMTTLLVGHGASLQVAVIATLLCRLATLWFAVLIGFAATAMLELKPSLRPFRSMP
jgi:uncharacterized protein (TIRG00374 family)